MIVLYYRDPGTLTDSQMTELASHLPAQQQEILAQMKNRRHRCEQLLAYIMLCHALKTRQKKIAGSAIFVEQFRHELVSPRYVKHNAPLWSFGSHGKPKIDNYEGVFFNISHCNEAVAVGISNQEIGIDVEGRRQFSDTLLQRAFNDDEQAMVHSAGEPELEFARIWTRKEAWFKYTGTGILMDHLKTTEAESHAAGCRTKTLLIDNSFWLSVTQSD